MFADIAAGVYSFRVEAADIPELAAAKEVTLAAGEEKEVSITVGTFGLELSGTVLDRDGRPVPGIRLEARKQMFELNEGDYYVADGSRLFTESGPDGMYRFTTLEEADYLVATVETETIRRSSECSGPASRMPTWCSISHASFRFSVW